jgi:hypothetical protein
MEGDIQDRAQELALTTDWNAAQIFKDLKRRFGERDEFPNKRSIERLVKEFRYADESPPWTVEDSDPEDAKLILEWLASFNGFGKGLKKVEAFWHLKIQRIAPDLSWVRAGVLANLYRIRTAKEASTEELDAYLGFAPWRGAEALERYKQMVGAGRVKPMVMWDTMVERVSPWGAIEAKDLGWPEPQTAQELAQAAQQEEGTT